MTPIDPITADNDSTLAGERDARPRHIHPKGQPRRSWAPADDSVPVIVHGHIEITPEPPVLHPMETLAMRNQMADDLWIATRKAWGVSVAVERLAPRLPRAVRAASRFVAAVVKTVAKVGIVIGGPLALAGVLYGLGV